MVTTERWRGAWLETFQGALLDPFPRRAFAHERAPFLVPFAVDPEFVGRDADLERLRQLFKESAAGVRRAALVGMGGVGKTQLAVEFAHRNRSDYPGGVYWVNAAAPLVAELATLAESLGLCDDT